MDKEKAKFILQSFRPDGADAEDPRFAEALALAVEDRELGEWLARERAADAAFAALLSEVQIPEDLRESVITILTGGGVDGELSALDADMVGALSSVRAPDGLRDEILAAMEVSASGKVTRFPEKERRRAPRWLSAAAVAAAVVLGALVALSLPPENIRVAGGELTPDAIETASIDFFEGPYNLDFKNRPRPQLVSWLTERELPEPGALPAKLIEAPPIGCREMKFEGKPASLVCFRVEGGVVHLIVFNLKDIQGSLPALTDRNCRGCKKSGWAMASWKDQERAMFLLTDDMPSEELAARVF